MKDKILVVLPVRIGSTRLARKALEKIGGKTMLEHAISNVSKSEIENILVATDYPEIARIAEASNVQSVMTSSECSSGTDRVYQALEKFDRDQKFEYVINVQGDMPFIDPTIINSVALALYNNSSEIVTPVVKVKNDPDNLAENYKISSASNVKVVCSASNKALYFSRSVIPHSADDYLLHVGVYGYTRRAIGKFVNLPQSSLEKIEKLEQLRALENDMNIDLVFVDNLPISVDTKEDLKIAKNYFKDINN